MTSNSPFLISGTRITWRGGGETVVIEPWGVSSVRVRAAMMSPILDTDWALLPAAEVDASVTVTDREARLVNGDITVVVTSLMGWEPQTGTSENGCRLSFYDKRGNLLFEESDRGGSLNLRPRHYRPLLGGDFAVTATFTAPVDEKLYGMGQYQQHILDVKGSTFELAHRNSQASIPFVLSSRGYGYFWHNPAIGRATFARNRTEWHAESSKQLDYWVTAGDTPATITAAYARATGHAPMMPERGLGFWQ